MSFIGCRGSVDERWSSVLKSDFTDEEHAFLIISANFLLAGVTFVAAMLIVPPDQLVGNDQSATVVQGHSQTTVKHPGI